VKVPSTRQQLQLKNKKTAGLIFEKTFKLQIASEKMDLLSGY
jgi:hypothetical protein